MLRIVRCTTDADRAPDVDGEFARIAGGLRSLEGNVGGFVGRHADPSEVRYALVTAWDGFGAMQAALGGDVLGAPFLGPVADVVRDVQVEHFERMDVPAIGSGGEASVLRMYAGSIPHRHAETFYSFTRDTAWPAVGAAEGLVAAHVGRRVATDVHHVAFVTVWRSWDALVAAFPAAPTRPLVVIGEEHIVAGLHVEHFDVVPLDPSA
jgi:heme-degrading monooxygenase HmoA